MILWLSSLHLHLSVNRDRHTHTHTHAHTQSSIFDEKGVDKQRSLLTGAEKCASGVDSEAAANILKIFCVIKAESQFSPTLHSARSREGVRVSQFMLRQKG